jgi:type IV secretory pathway VirB4 component
MEPHTHIGTTNTGNDVWLSRDERLEHVAVIGATGTGKSTLIEHLVAQDIVPATVIR